MIGIPKLVGSGLAVSFFTLFITSTSVTQIQLAYAGGKSPYESGYDHGCEDADLSPSDRYINEPGKGPSFHTNEFIRGYNDGYDDCSGSSGGSHGNNGNGNGDGNGGDGGGDTFADGQRAGKAAEHSDAINGRPSDASCGTGHSNSYCAGYKLGYNIEYQVTRFVQD